MGFFSNLKKDLALGIRLDIMKAKGIYTTDNYNKSCLFCRYWDSSQEFCAFHQLRFNGEENCCSRFSHR